MLSKGKAVERPEGTSGNSSFIPETQDSSTAIPKARRGEIAGLGSSKKVSGNTLVISDLRQALRGDPLGQGSSNSHVSAA